MSICVRPGAVERAITSSLDLASRLRERRKRLAAAFEESAQLLPLLSLLLLLANGATVVVLCCVVLLWQRLEKRQRQLRRGDTATLASAFPPPAGLFPDFQFCSLAANKTELSNGGDNGGDFKAGKLLLRKQASTGCLKPFNGLASFVIAKTVVVSARESPGYQQLGC